METKCKECGRTLTTYPSKPKVYCNRECQRLYESEHKRDGYGKRADYLTKNCKVCGEAFEVLASKADRRSHCSRSCRSKDPEIVAKLRRNGAMIRCDGCGKDFWRQKSTIREKNYCSLECTRSRVIVTCDACGKEIEKIPSTLRANNFCGTECKKAFFDERSVVECEWCGKSFKRGKHEIMNRNFCSRKCYGAWVRLHPDAEETRGKLRDVMLRNRDNPGFIEKMEQAWSKFHQANKLEQLLAKHYPGAIYFIGDGKMWVTLKDGRHKCPDFKVHGQRKFIEIWGNYWHKGEDPDSLVEAYGEIGFSCLVVWENEIHDDWRNTVKKINVFLKN